jgi:hypothetical protein
VKAGLRRVGIREAYGESMLMYECRPSRHAVPS